MQKLNEAPILEQTEGKNETILLAAIWKLTGSNIVKLTGEDLKAFMDAHNDNPIMFLHGHAAHLEVSVITLEAAQAIAEHQKTLAPTTPQ